MSSVKGYSWSFIFLLAAVIYGSIPTYLIVVYWQWLNAFTILLFLWIISLIVTLIYLVAMIRAIVQRKSEDLGIPKGVKYLGLITTVVIITFMTIWYILFQEVAFFTMRP
ncbi:MAG: hypothetical protein ACTSR5_15760 [Promethearchaeota archaeon]